MLPGAFECIATGSLSSLHRQNAAATSFLSGFNSDAVVGKGGGSGGGFSLSRDARWPILVDPQTAGGLLVGVSAGQAEACVSDLRAVGYGGAAFIGRVLERRVGYGNEGTGLGPLISMCPVIQS